MNKNEREPKKMDDTAELISERVTLVLPFYAGAIEEKDIKKIVVDNKRIEVSSSNLFVNADADLKRHYSKRLLGVLKGEVTENIGGKQRVFTWECDIFADGFHIIRYELPVNQSVRSLRSLADALWKEVVSFYDGTSFLRNHYRQIITKFESFCQSRPELLLRNGDALEAGAFLYPIVVAVPAQDFDIQSIKGVEFLLFPDLSKENRALGSFDKSKYLQEVCNGNLMYASWEAYLLVGKMTTHDIESVVLLCSYVLRTWLRIHFLDKVSTTFINTAWKDIIGKRKSEQFLMSLRSRRLEYMTIRSELVDYDSNMSLRFMTLLDRFFAHSNFEALCSSVEKKLACGIDDYTWYTKEVESRRADNFNITLQILTVILTIFGTMSAIQIFVELWGIQHITFEARLLTTLLYLIPTFGLMCYLLYRWKKFNSV